MDAEKSTPYHADIVIRLERRGSEQAPTRIARIRKDRSGLFEGKVIENPSYHTFQPLLERLSAIKDTIGIEDEEEASEKDKAHMENADERKSANALIRRIEKSKKSFKDIDAMGSFDTVLARNEAIPLKQQTSNKLQLVLEELSNEYQSVKTARETK